MSSDADGSRLGIYQAIFTEQILGLQLEILGGAIVVQNVRKQPRKLTAQAQGLIRVGDGLVSIGDINVKGLTLRAAANIIERSPRPITLSLIRWSFGMSSSSESKGPVAPPNEVVMLQLPLDYSPAANETDWTSRYKGSVTNLKEALEAGRVTLPPNGVLIFSKRMKSFYLFHRKDEVRWSYSPDSKSWRPFDTVSNAKLTNAYSKGTQVVDLGHCVVNLVTMTRSKGGAPTRALAVRGIFNGQRVQPLGQSEHSGRQTGLKLDTAKIEAQYKALSALNDDSSGNSHQSAHKRSNSLYNRSLLDNHSRSSPRTHSPNSSPHSSISRHNSLSNHGKSSSRTHSGYASSRSVIRRSISSPALEVEDTELSSIKEYIQHLPTGTRVAVLIFQGSFCPITVGHIQTVVRARELLLRKMQPLTGELTNNFSGCIAFVCCNSDEFVTKKMASLGEKAISKADREKLIHLSTVHQRAWLTVPKFRHLERLTNKFKHLRFVKFFLSGADDVVKYRKWKQAKASKRMVCIGRQGFTEQVQETITKHELSPNLFVLGPALDAPSSSTRVRLALREDDMKTLRTLLHPAVLEWCKRSGPYRPDAGFSKSSKRSSAVPMATLVDASPSSTTKSPAKSTTSKSTLDSPVLPLRVRCTGDLGNILAKAKAKAKKGKNKKEEHKRAALAAAASAATRMGLVVDDDHSDSDETYPLDLRFVDWTLKTASKSDETVTQIRLVYHDSAAVTVSAPGTIRYVLKHLLRLHQNLLKEPETPGSGESRSSTMDGTNNLSRWVHLESLPKEGLATIIANKLRVEIRREWLDLSFKVQRNDRKLRTGLRSAPIRNDRCFMRNSVASGSTVQLLMVDMSSGFALVLCEDGIQGYIQLKYLQAPDEVDLGEYE